MSKKRHPLFKDITGKKFGRWIVLELSGKRKNKAEDALWLCRCDCGTVRKVGGTHLRAGTSKSCGCLQKELQSEMMKGNKYVFKHGKEPKGLYNSWSAMKQRCYNFNRKAYKYYGARGIKVCPEWLDKEKGFINFRDWALINGWKEGLHLHRKNSNSNYSPEDCKWVLSSQNAKEVWLKRQYEIGILKQENIELKKQIETLQEIRQI